MNNEILTYSLKDLEQLIAGWNQPRFRAKQIYEWIHGKQVSSFDAMGNVPKALRTQLAERFPEESTSVYEKQVSKDGTRKYVIQLSDGNLVETVAMPVDSTDHPKERLTACVSSQVGCAMECLFCATGKEGCKRNLKASEIRDQVITVQQDMGQRVSNVVVMGQGEPFLNYDEALKALQLINDQEDLRIGARHITISTCGIIDGINKLANEPEQFTLAVSLHSAVQKTRDLLMPRVAHQSLSDLKEALKRYREKTGRRITFEYLLLDGINDDEEHLQALIEYCEDILCHVNLLPMNTVEGSSLQPSPSSTVNHWIESLQKASIEATLRRSRGSDIDGACGQLKNSLMAKNS